jgi:hypothetical protein
MTATRPCKKIVSNGTKYNKKFYEFLNSSTATAKNSIYHEIKLKSNKNKN